jgi:putative endopeptidase
MKPEIRIQDDLFGHVNGAWLEQVEIPADRSTWGPFIELVERAEEQVRAIIDELVAADPGSLDADSAKIAQLYKSFMDTEQIEKLGLAPVQPMLDQVNALADLAQLGKILGGQARVGVPGLFGSYVTTDAKDSDRYLVHLCQGGLGLPDESYYTDEKFAEIRSAYVEYLEAILRLAGFTDAAAQAELVLRVEARLAEGHWERAETRDVQKTYNLMSFAELVALSPDLDWAGYVEHLGGNSETLAEVVVQQPSFFAHLGQVIQEVPLETWKVWLSTRVLRAAAPYLTEEFVNTNFDFYGRVLSGTPELRARYKRAVQFVEGAIGEAVGKRYVERHFPPEAKEKIDELVSNLLEAYRQSIGGLEWMSEPTKQRAFAKLDLFRPKIGYPNKFRDYSELQVGTDLLANAAAAAAFETERQIRKIGAPVDRDEWFMLPQTVNAYYNPGTNEICFPAAILQRPFFAPEADPAENYGGIGAVIGHEIGHGFDDQGAQYDGEGNLNDWWTAADKAAFEVKSKALITQYDGFSPRSLPGEYVNGALTVGENIGDLGGLTIAHKAYLISLGQEPMPSREEMTGSQRLFTNWGYIWRTARRQEIEQQYLTIDPHSPPEFRANIVRNLDEFHEAFATMPGDLLWLDPEDRVRIW